MNGRLQPSARSSTKAIARPTCGCLKRSTITRYVRELGETITLWTIQSPSFLETLERQGYADSENTDPDASTRWMADWMRDHGFAKTLRPPVWSWFAYQGIGNRKPDLRRRWHLPRGEPGVRIELRVPIRSVLLSQFAMWIWVMNGHYVPCCNADWRRFERRGSPAAEIEPSWSRVFDLEIGSPRFWKKPADREVQACITRVTAEMVVRVDRFRAQ